MRCSLLFFFVAVLAAACVWASVPARRECVLEGEGENCRDVMPTTVHMGAPCAREDETCWCVRAVKYTNEVRRRRNPGVRMLKVGTVSQLENAVRYAGELAKRGGLKHQNLPSATKEVQCKRWIGGENIAYNYETDDVVKRCVEQWEDSKGHLENIVRDWFAEVVVGVHFARDGRVYCVQTFAKMHDVGTYGSEFGRGCEQVGGDGGLKSMGDVQMGDDGGADAAGGTGDDGNSDGSDPDSTKPMPMGKGKRQRKQGNRSCRCLEVGERCWHSLRKRSGFRCKMGVRADQQPRECVDKCCEYCATYSSNPQCTNAVVKNICQI